MEPQPDSLAEYAEMTGSPVKDEIQQRHPGLPPHLLSTSLLSWDGIAEATAALRLSPGGTLVDLAREAGRLGCRVGDLAATRLGAGSADAVLCVDAIHFASQPGADGEIGASRLAGPPLGVQRAFRGRWFARPGRQRPFRAGQAMSLGRLIAVSLVSALAAPGARLG